MKKIFASILMLLLVLASCVPYDDDTCRLPMFESKSHFEYSNESKIIDGLTVELKATSGARLSNIIIEISFPSGVSINKAFYISDKSNISQDGIVIDKANNIVTLNYTKNIKAEKIMCVTSIKSLTNMWNKPIQINISHYFKQIINCGSGGMKDGKYTEKTSLIISPNDGKFYPTEGGVYEDWVYHGK